MKQKLLYKVGVTLFMLISINNMNPQNCPTSGSMTFVTGNTDIQFNTINNPTTKSAEFNNDTSIPTTVAQNSTNNYSINLNTADFWISHVITWIDWNQDYDFLYPEVSFDLGTTLNVTNGGFPPSLNNNHGVFTLGTPSSKTNTIENASILSFIEISSKDVRAVLNESIVRQKIPKSI